MSRSHERSRHFRSVGYLRLLDVLTSDQTAELRRFVLEQKAAEDEVRRIRGQSEVVKMYGLYKRNPRLIHNLITNPRLVEALCELLGPNVVFVCYRYKHEY